MFRDRAKFFLLYLTILVSSCSIGHSIGFDIGAGMDQLAPSGTISYKGGTSIDLKSDLLYDKTYFLDARARFDLLPPLPNLGFAASFLNFSGTGSKNVTFQFGNVTTFTAGVPFTSTLKLDHYDAILFYPIPFLSSVTDNKLDVDLGLELRLYDFKAEIVQSQTGLSDSKIAIIPFPMGYLDVKVEPIESLSIEAEVKGIAYGGNQLVDILGLVKYKVLPLIFVSAGYKSQAIQLSQYDIQSSMTFAGPILGLGVTF